ncbi:MAG TPA: DUF2975 domain-containing protein [Hyphomicrobium sp.]|nr:DUF2975 domain-containing protein [Hyphomicrobium sp.]
MQASVVAGSLADRLEPLPPRLGLMCHLIRWSAVAWIGWALGLVLMVWSSPGTVERVYGRFLNTDLGGLPIIDYAAAFFVVLVDWSVSALVVVFVWRLFGAYLRGSIFTVESVEVMRCVGWIGVAAVAADIASRPLVTLLLTRHLSVGHAVHVWAEPNDMLHVLIALFIVALAHVYTVGVQIADENRQIV